MEFVNPLDEGASEAPPADDQPNPLLEPGADVGQRAPAKGAEHAEGSSKKHGKKKHLPRTASEDAAIGEITCTRRPALLVLTRNRARWNRFA